MPDFIASEDWLTCRTHSKLSFYAALSRCPNLDNHLHDSICICTIDTLLGFLSNLGVFAVGGARGYIHVEMSRLVGKPTMWFPNGSDTNRAVQAQKMPRGLKFWI